MSHHPTERFIQAYVHQGRIGVLVEFGLDTFIITTTEDFISFAKDIAMHVAAMNPPSVGELLSQQYVRGSGESVHEHLQQASGAFGEKVTITRIVRWDQELAPPPPESPVPTPPKTPAVILRFGAREK